MGEREGEKMMESKTADLTKCKSRIFVGVGCKQTQVYALADDGYLYIYDQNRKLLKWMNLKLDSALGLAMGTSHLYCFGTEGLIRVFGVKNIEQVVVMPKPPAIG